MAKLGSSLRIRLRPIEYPPGYRGDVRRLVEKTEEEIHGLCDSLPTREERARCRWEAIKQLFISADSMRYEIPVPTELDINAWHAVERCIDMGREISRWMADGEPRWIDFGYIEEKYRKLRDDLDYLMQEVEKRY